MNNVANNKDLIEKIEEIDPNAVTEDLTNKELSALLKELKTEPVNEEAVDEDVDEAVDEAVEATGAVIADGVSLVCKKGILVAGDSVCVKDISGGQEQFDLLVSKKLIKA